MSVSGSVNPEVAATFTGFKITDYSDEQAIVLLATSTPPMEGEDPLLTAYPVQMAWAGGDWKLVLPTQADNIDAAEIKTLDGFTKWDGADE